MALGRLLGKRIITIAIVGIAIYSTGSTAFADPHGFQRWSSTQHREVDDRISVNLGSQLSRKTRSHSREKGRQGYASELQLDTPETAIMGGKRDSRFLNFYRGLIYSRYFQDSNRADSFSDLESQALAEDLLTYQTSKTLRWLVENSAIARIYDNFVATYSRYTTASVERRVDGSLALGDPTSKKRKLFQLKLHASSRNGIEPRVVIDDHVTLRYDLLHQQALLEYQINF